MAEKTCNRCKLELELNNFNKNSKSNDGLNYICKGCKSTIDKEHYTKNSTKIKSQSNKRRIENPNYQKNWIENNQELIRIYKDNNKDREKEYSKEHYIKNKIKILASNKEYREKNPNISKTYWENNKHYLIPKNIETQSNRMKIDPIFKLKQNTRSLIYTSFKRACNGKFNKSQRTQNILGCTIDEFIIHLQSKFVKGMTLENHGEWEIDHIKPISLALTEEEIYELNHYTNLQPLWRVDNRKKSNIY